MAEKETIEDLEAKILKIRDRDAKAAKAKAVAHQKRKAVRDAANKVVANKAQLERVRVVQAEKYFPLVSKHVKSGLGTPAQKKLIDIICKLQETGEIVCDCKPAKTSKKD